MELNINFDEELYSNFVFDNSNIYKKIAVKISVFQYLVPVSDILSNPSHIFPYPLPIPNTILNPCSSI